MSFGLPVPDPWLDLPDTEKPSRGWIDGDRCAIDDREFYVRGCLEIPVRERSGPFILSVWVAVSRPSFHLICDLWNVSKRDHTPPLFGWLCNTIPAYPQTFALKTSVRLRNDATLPSIELEPTDHPLSVEQRKGITIDRIAEIAASAQMH